MNTDIARALELLEQGEVIGLPTETVYGLAADATQARAVARIFEVKGRPNNHPLILHLGSKEWLTDWTQLTPGSPQAEAAEKLSARFWPGPLTLVLPRSARVPLEVTGGLDTVAVRVPAHPVALEVLLRLNRPLAAPSANRFGSVSPTTRAHVLADLGTSVPLVLEGGSCEVGLESTIVDLTRPEPRLLRPGGIALSELEAVLGCPVLPADGRVRAPGTLASHYAPRAPVVLVEEEQLDAAIEVHQGEPRLGVICQRAPASPASSTLSLVVLSSEPSVAARALYATLRQLDEEGCSLILSTLPSEEGLGAAIADRLRRAAAPRI